MGVHFDAKDGFDLKAKIVTTDGTTNVVAVGPPASDEQIIVVWANGTNTTGINLVLSCHHNDGSTTAEVYRSSSTGSTFNFFKNNSTNVMDIPPVLLKGPDDTFELKLTDAGAIKIAVFYASYNLHRHFTPQPKAL